MIRWLTGRIAQRDDDEIKYKNPEYTTLGHCLQTRYAVLLGLTPQECMLCRRIILSVVLGMMIGFERRRPDRPAGVRTMSLVSLGSCVFTIDSMFAFSSSPDSWDSSRVAAAIPSGVGFLVRLPLFVRFADADLRRAPGSSTNTTITTDTKFTG